jgi:hypothetical protein
VSRMAIESGDVIVWVVGVLGRRRDVGCYFTPQNEFDTGDLQVYNVTLQEEKHRTRSLVCSTSKMKLCFPPQQASILLSNVKEDDDPGSC